MRRLLFLDVDGVLNKNNTVERMFPPNSKEMGGKGFIGLDTRILNFFLPWLNSRPYEVVLSSTWRNHDYSRDELSLAGIEWVGVTGHRSNRGYEIQEWLINNTVPEETKFAILDDIGPDSFLNHQRRYLVQTSYLKGVEPKHLNKIDKILT